MQDFTMAVESSRMLTAEENAVSNAHKKFREDYENYDRTGDVSQIWADWEKEMQWIQDAYICSGRRILLKWLASHVADAAWLNDHIQNVQPKKKDKTGMLTLSEDGKTVIYQKSKANVYAFGTDMAAAVDLSDKDADACCKLIRDLVCGGHNTESELTLIKDAFRANKTHSWLSKTEAFQLGRLLGFSADEMAEFLLRYFQDGCDGDGNNNCNIFNFKKSEDLIEYFCFRYREQDPETIKEAYGRNARKIEKAAIETPETAQVTLEISGAVRQNRADWMAEDLEADERKEKFLAWLDKYAPVLDTDSKSATELVRLLARKALQLAAASPDLQDPAELPAALPVGDLHKILRLPDVIRDEQDRDVLGAEGWTDETWRSAAKSLQYYLYQLENNKVYGDPSTIDWSGNAIVEKEFSKVVAEQRTHRPETSSALFSFFAPRKGRKKGEDDVRIGDWTKAQWQNDPQDQSHLEKLLTAAVAPQKSDVLLLIFVISNLIWIRDNTELPQKLKQFEAVSKDVLDGETYPSLGKYYTPHFTEFSMLSSIVFSAVSDDYYIPLHWYLLLLTSHDRQADE